MEKIFSAQSILFLLCGILGIHGQQFGNLFKSLYGLVENIRGVLIYKLIDVRYQMIVSIKSRANRYVGKSVILFTL